MSKLAPFSTGQNLTRAEKDYLFDLLGYRILQSALSAAQLLKAGEALVFTDGICHGLAARTNSGERRALIYRYSPHVLASRFSYVPSEELMVRLTSERRTIAQPVAPRLAPERVLCHSTSHETCKR